MLKIPFGSASVLLQARPCQWASFGDVDGNESGRVDCEPRDHGMAARGAKEGGGGSWGQVHVRGVGVDGEEGCRSGGVEKVGEGWCWSRWRVRRDGRAAVWVDGEVRVGR